MNFVLHNSSIIASTVFTYVTKKLTQKPQYSIIKYHNRTITTPILRTITQTTNATKINNLRYEKLLELCVEDDKIDFKFECFFFKLTTDIKFALLFLLFFFVIFLDIFLNIIVLISILKTKKRKRVDLCFLSNAIADLLMGLVIMPCTTIIILFNHFPLGKYACFLWNSLDFTAGTVSMLHIMFISYDRYLSVSKPLQYTQKSTSNEAFFSITRMPTSAILILIWLVSICAWLPVVFYLKTQENTTIVNDRFKLSNNFTKNNSNIDFIFDKIDNNIMKENLKLNHTSKINSIECSLNTNPFIIVPHSVFVYFIPMILIIIFYTRTIIIVQRKIRRKRRQSVVSSTKSLNKSSSNHEPDSETDEELNLFNRVKNSFKRRFPFTKRAKASSQHPSGKQRKQRQNTTIDLNSTTILQKLFSKLNLKTNLANINNNFNNNLNYNDSSNTNTITINTDFTSSSLVRRSALEINNISTKLQENETSINLYVDNNYENDACNEPSSMLRAPPQKSMTSDIENDDSSVHSSIITPNQLETKPNRTNEIETFLNVNSNVQKLRMQFFMKRPSIETSVSDIELNKLKVSATLPVPPSTPTTSTTITAIATTVATTTTTTVTTTTILNKTTSNTLVVPRKNIISFNDEVISQESRTPQKSDANNNLLPIIKRRKSCLGPTELNVNFNEEQKTVKTTACELKRNLSLFNNFQPNNHLNTIFSSNTNSNSSSDVTTHNSPLLQKQCQISPSSTSICNHNTHPVTLVQNYSTASMPTQVANISGNTKREKYVTYKLGIIMVAFIVCWLPFALFWSIDSFCKSCINPQLYLLSFWLAYLNSILTPLILLYTNTKYRRNIFFLKRCFTLPCNFCSSKHSTESYANVQAQPLDPNRQTNKSLYRNRAAGNASNYHLMNRDKSCNFDGASGVYGMQSAVCFHN